MLTPEQREMWQRLNELTGGLEGSMRACMDERVPSLDVTTMARCHLAIVREIRMSMFELVSFNELYPVREGK